MSIIDSINKLDMVNAVSLMFIGMLCVTLFMLAGALVFAG